MKGAAVAVATVVASVALMVSSLTMPAAAETVSPTPTPTPTADAPPTPSPTPTPTPTPTDDPSPTPTEEPSPTPTVEPSPSPTVEPTPDATPTPVAPEPDEVVPEARLGITAVPVPGATRITTGSDPYVASTNASRALFPGGASTVILAPGLYPIFASTASALAADREAPILYVQPGAIPGVVMNELRRLAPSSILVVGGPAYVSDAVVNAARTVSPTVTRLGGANLYETSRLIFAQQTAAADTVYIAGGLTLYDAPLASVLGAAHGKRVLVVNGHGAPPDAATIDLLRAAGTRSIVIVRSAAAAMLPAYEPALRAAGFQVTRTAHIDARALSSLVSSEVPSPAASVLVNVDRPTDVGLAGMTASVLRQPLYFPYRECVPHSMSSLIAGTTGRVLAVADSLALAAAVESNTSCNVEKPRLQSALNSALRSVMSQYPGITSVTVRQIGELGQITEVNGGVRREPASMMKIFAAWAAYKLIDEGRAYYSTMLPSGVKLGICIHVMLYVSDNFCHTDIVHFITIPELNRMIRAAGFTNTVYGNVPYGADVLYAGNRTTTNDLAWMIERLANGSILSKANSNQILAIMRSQIWRSRIASGIPPGISQASKPGALWIASGLMQGDTALIHGTWASYSISIIGDAAPPQEALRAMSRVVYTHLNGAFGTAATYPAQQMETRTPSLLRSSPNGAVVATVPARYPLAVHNTVRVWYEVQYGSRRLWIHYTGLRNR